MRTSQSGKASPASGPSATLRRAASTTGAGIAAFTLAALAACSASIIPTSTPRAEVASPATSAAASGTSTWRSHPCVLLTGAEASAALGQRVTAIENAPNRLCQYIQTDLSATPADIQTSVGDGRMCQQWTVSLGSKRPVPVSGVGDEALWDVGYGGRLCVRSGSIGLLVIIGGPKVSQSPDHGLAMAESLARLILPRL
jgi:hypothetical protein